MYPNRIGHFYNLTFVQNKLIEVFMLGSLVEESEEWDGMK